MLCVSRLKRTNNRRGSSGGVPHVQGHLKILRCFRRVTLRAVLIPEVVEAVNAGCEIDFCGDNRVVCR